MDRGPGLGVLDEAAGRGAESSTSTPGIERRSPALASSERRSPPNFAGSGSRSSTYDAHVNPLRRLFFGPGTFAEPLRTALLAEDPVFFEEGLPAVVVYHHNYRAPGHEPGWERVASAGAVAVTPRRLVVWVRRGKHIELPMTHPWPAGITMRHDRRDRVVFAYDAGTFSEVRSGDVEVRLRTRRAAELAGVVGRTGPVEPVWSELVADDIVYLERGLAATVARDDDAPPGTPGTSGRPQRGVATVAVSSHRFVVWVGGGKFIDVPREDDGGPAEIAVGFERPGLVRLDFVATSLGPERPHFMVTLETSRAAELARVLGVAWPPSASAGA